MIRLTNLVWIQQSGFRPSCCCRFKLAYHHRLNINDSCQLMYSSQLIFILNYFKLDISWRVMIVYIYSKHVSIDISV